MSKSTIPPGFVRCAVCGLFNGATNAKNLNWLGGDRPRGKISVTCLCHGILCSRCKKNRILRPISNVYYPESNSIEHVPYFFAMVHCDDCRAKESAPDRPLRAKRLARKAAH